jgi:glutamate dehydrogenase
VEAALQHEMMLDVVRLVKRSTRWLLRNRRHQLAPSLLIEEFAGGIDGFLEQLPSLLRGNAQAFFEERRDRYRAGGADEPLAATVAAGLYAATGLAIIDVASRAEAPLGEVAELYFHLGERLELDWFGGQILRSAVDNEWQALARESYLEDLQAQQCTLAMGILRLRCEGLDSAACVARWEEQQAPLIARWREMLAELHATTAPDFAMFAVANRELLDLAQSSRRP